MSTKTLRAITLPTGEVKMRTVTAPPIEPVTDLLAGALAKYAQAIDGLELIKDQAERAKAEEEAALSSEALSDEELTIKVIGAKRSQNIYASREGARSQALSELETLIGTARQELSMLVTAKRNREREILASKAMQVYGVPAEGRTELFERLLRRGDLEELEFWSKPLEDIRALEPGAFYPGTPESSVAYAKELLWKFQELKKLEEI